MRRFRKNTNRTNTNAEQENDKTSPDPDCLIPSISNLFVDSPGSATYVQSPQDAALERDLTKPTSERLNNAKGIRLPVQFTSPVSLLETDTYRNSPLFDDGFEIIGEQLCDQPGGSIVNEPFPTSGRCDSLIEEEPKCSRSSKSSLFEQPKSSRSSKPTGISGLTESLEESFDVCGCDDETFMIEEATRRDGNLGTSAADLETATVFFKKREDKRNENVDMSAEEILRTQRWGRSQEKLPAMPATPGTPGTPDTPGTPKTPGTSGKRSTRRKRPPPLVNQLALPSDSPTASHEKMFGNDGGFVACGFKITADGILKKPAADLRKDETKTLRGTNAFDDIRMRSLNEFKKGPTIGAGAAGRVYLALHQPTSLAVAMKTVNVFDKGLRSQLMKELVTLSRHISRYLVRFYGAFYDGCGAVHIALEFMDHGCLQSFVKKNGAIPEHVVRVIAVDCVRGLRFLRKYHVLHRDLKTANILLSREQSCAKVSDFGLARDLDAGKSLANTFVGTVAYMSPERLQGSEYTYASDIWALGVSLAECLMGKYPFAKPQNYFDCIDVTLTTNLFDQNNKEMNSVSKDAKSFILWCTDSDPKKRPTAEQLLEHPWLKGFQPDRKYFGEWLDLVSAKETPKNATKS